MSDDLAKEIAKGALRIEWRDTETAARRVAEYAADRIEELEAENARLRGALSYTVRADNLREAYHALPNERAPIGGKRSRKGHARDAWLRAFRKAAKNARTALAALKGEDRG